MFCQIRGSKFVRLIDPKERENLYLYDDLMRQNSSQVDVENPDLIKFPLFSNVKCYDSVLGEGQCLFIPKGWFHHVRALVEDATEMADWEAADALYELDMREWEGADLPVHHLRFRGLQRAATSLTHLQEFMFVERLRQDALIPTKTQKKKLVPTNNNALIKLSALTTLYEVFPDVPPKTIKHFAKENGYNFELTANCLLNISESFDAKLDLISTEEQLEEQQNSINIIVPSKNPNIIIPYGAPPPIKKGEDGGKFGNLSPSLNFNDSLQTISQLLEQLDFERRHCLSMANQVRGKPHGGALCGHYMRRAIWPIKLNKYELTNSGSM
uniref:JmjC domain-containing protein n=1 Tax=Meloidogyne floridensis TaxID=298350 RepID=A0A915NTQ1_9BILA